MEDLEALFEATMGEARARIERCSSTVIAQPQPDLDENDPLALTDGTGIHSVELNHPSDINQQPNVTFEDDPLACELVEQKPLVSRIDTGVEIVKPEDISSDSAIFKEIGSMARALHSGLKGMGYDKTLGALVEDGIPDVRSRLQYVNEKTEEAASKTIVNAECAQLMFQAIQNDTASLSRRWKAFLASGEMDRDTFKSVVRDTLSMLQKTGHDAKEINGHLMGIVLAQEFQDLTGQVIRKVIETTEHVESQLVNLLIAVAPPGKKERIGADLMQGPTIRCDGSGEVLNSQEQVDDLLASLGF